MVMTTEGNVSPTPDPAAAKRPGGTGKAKTISKAKGGSLPGNPTRGGQGRVRVGGRRGR